MFYVPIEDIYKNDRNQVATNISAQEVGFSVNERPQTGRFMRELFKTLSISR